MHTNGNIIMLFNYMSLDYSGSIMAHDVPHTLID